MENQNQPTRLLTDEEIALLSTHASEAATLNFRHQNERLSLAQKQATELAHLRAKAAVAAAAK
jgi:hypothetical protein